MSEKFWLCHTDPIWTMDGAAGTLYTIQMNLCAGTIARYVKHQPYLEEILQKVLSFEYSSVLSVILFIYFQLLKPHLLTISGQFCLTEVGHGLNALHLETTATFANGEFVLNTPSEGAAKYVYSS